MISTLRSLRIFFSYSTRDKEIVGKLKNHLEDIGFEVFLAHEDIKPCKEWLNEILDNLKRSDIFIPFLSINFKNSEWTDQETGVAIAEDKFIIPLQVHFPPYGFIGKYQSLKANIINLKKTAEEIIDLIFNSEKFRKNIKEFVINKLLESGSFLESIERARLLNKFNEFTPDEINKICDGFIKNNQISGSVIARPIVKSLIKKHKEKIDSELYRRYKELIG